MRRLLLCSVLLAPLPAMAQERSLWELIDPDRIVTRVIQYGIAALRTQGQFGYATLSSAIREGRIAIEGVSLTLPRNLTGGRDCPVRAGSLEFFADDIFALDTQAGTVELRDVAFPLSCLGRAAIAAAPFLPEGVVAVPSVTLRYDYTISSGALDLAGRAAFEELAGVEFDAAFDYITIRVDGEDSWPEGRLASAALTIENLGGFEAAAPFLPPEATDPEQAAIFVTRGIGGAVEGLAPGEAPKAAKTFVTELAAAWTDFVADPDRLVIETGFDAEEPRAFGRELLDAVAIDAYPVFTLLEPVAGADRAAERAVIPAALVRRALEGDATLTSGERRSVGMAVLEGRRAPRNLAIARQLLTPLAEGGDGEAALALGTALADLAPADAYALAVAAGPADVPGTRALLDRLEGELPFATRMRLQSAVADPGPDDLTGPADELRARAEAHLRGTGAGRSLRAALIYASVAAGRGDRAAADLLGRIDRAVPAEGAATWADARAEAEAIALGGWLSDR